MKMAPEVLVSLLIAAPVALAQSASRQATRADSVMIRHNIYRELFAGITLTPERRARVEVVIADADRKSWTPPDFPTCAKMRDWRIGQAAPRDSTLFPMKTTAADSAKFATRAATFILDPCPPGHP